MESDACEWEAPMCAKSYPDLIASWNEMVKESGEPFRTVPPGLTAEYVSLLMPKEQVVVNTLLVAYIARLVAERPSESHVPVA